MKKLRLSFIVEFLNCFSRIVRGVILITGFAVFACSKMDDTRVKLQKVQEPVIIELERIIQSNSINVKPFKAALMLPLGNQTKAGIIAKSMKDAAQLALFEFNRENFILINYDTKGDEKTVEDNVKKAIQNQVEIIIGPLFAKTTKATKEALGKKYIPIISFTNDARVLGKGVYANSYMVQSEIHRITKYAVRNGMDKFVMITPNSDFGDLTVETFSKFVERAKGEIISIQRYDNNLQSRIKAAKNTAKTMYEEAIKGEPVDAVFIPDGNDSLRIIANELLYYYNTEFDPKEDEDNKLLRIAKKQGKIRQLQIDRLGVMQQGTKFAGSIAGARGKKQIATEDIPQYKLIGIGTWNNKKILSEPSLQGAWFAMPPRQRRKKFQQKFENFFGYKPHRIASLAYDTVALIIVISNQVDKKKYNNIKKLIENNDGFNGVNGYFKFVKNGQTLRSLDIYEVKEKGNIQEISSSKAILY